MVNSWIILYYNYIILYYILIFGDAHQSVINPLTVINIHIKRIDGWPYQPYTMFWPWHIHLANSHLRPRNYVKFVAHRNGSSWKQRFDSHSAVDTAFIIICIYIVECVVLHSLCMHAFECVLFIQFYIGRKPGNPAATTIDAATPRRGARGLLVGAGQGVLMTPI